MFNYLFVHLLINYYIIFMKNNFYLLICFISFFGAFSQTKKEREELMAYYKDLPNKIQSIDTTRHSKKAYEEMIEKAKLKGVPLVVESSDNNLGYLVRMDGDLPLYYQTYNKESAITSRILPVQSGGSMNLNLAGQNMIVGVWDQNHPKMNHADYGSRVTITDGSATAVSTHSSHVTGTILSSGVSSSSFNGRGMAYQASGWVNDWTNDIGEMDQYSDFGLLISNHSYGLIADNLPVWYFGAYTSDSYDVDNICFNKPKYQPVYAAGNDRDNSNINPTKGGNDLLTGDKVSKNSLVIGAVGYVPSYMGPSDVVISNFSNYGPTDDFRIKPDLVAKGVNVFSTTDTSTTSYGFLSGTSMAAPGVTGGITLLQQYFGSPYMLSSTLRGLVIHTADEAGPLPGPDHMYGYGLLNIAKSVEVLQDINVESKVEENILNNNQQYTINVLANGLEDLKVTLSWTDRPGTVVNGVVDSQTPKLINDLDVRVLKNGQTFFPWRLNKDFANPFALQDDNDVDVLEKIEVENPVGVYQIVVTHKGSLVGGSQNYSLIVTGINSSLSNVEFDQSVEGNVVVWSSNKSDNLLSYEVVNVDGFLNKINIYDLNGRVVRCENTNNLSGDIDVSNLARGMYIVDFEFFNNFKLSKKVFVK